MKNKLIIGIAVLVLVISGYIFLSKKDKLSFYTEQECVEKTQLPCKYYYVGDIGHEWKPSTFRTKEECEASYRPVASVCFIPKGNFKEVRWIDVVDSKK